ncbi:nucleotidyl transferase family protein [Spiroplasma culicicola]|uniref:FAD synthase n=1 Tax=Spiroplasma culicicola AES-1 TaxID=1276246 RepID=W6A7D9_9MOLU|nr:hypothetical protein [Spiroplasma culicicola]AHI52755.1 bifunctional riboflavin kinase/FMN adenylyltransferase [Spiroplasma culicicola AES-1]
MEKKELYLTNEEQFNIGNTNIICIGFFDGLHKLHRQIIDKTKQLAQEFNEKWSIVTFSEKVSDFLSKQHNQFQSKIIKYSNIEQQYNPDYLFEIQVNQNTISIDKDQFISYLKNNLNVNKIVVGSDFAFGHMGKGHVDDLVAAFGQENVIVFQRVSTYSTTDLKELLKDGEIEQLNEKMGQNYQIQLENTHEGHFKIIDTFVQIKNANYVLLVDGKEMIAQFDRNKVFFKDYIAKQNIIVEMIKKV